MLKPTILFTLVTLCAPLVHADMRAVIKVRSEGGPSSSGSEGQEVTITQVGAKARIERGGESKWVLIDGTHRWLVDDGAKTYAELSARQRSAAGNLKSDVKVEATSETKDILGVSASKFDLSGTFTMSQSGSGRGRLGGLRRGGSESPSIKMGGSLWGTKEITGVSLSDFLGERGAMFAQNEKFSQLGLVLEGNIRIQVPQLAGRGGQDMKVDFSTLSLDKGAQDAKLVTLPEGYRKVDPPSQPNRRVRGGGLATQ